MSEAVVLVGGGLAAVSAAELLRAEGFEGRISLISEEIAPPYDRPPLSKAYLMGEAGEAEISLKQPEWYRENEIDLILADPAVSIDGSTHMVALRSGRSLGYDKILVATGARARVPENLPRPVAAKACSLRSRDDAERIRERAEPGTKVAIIGGGVIGSEVAATLAEAKCEVSLTELSPRLMSRVLVPEASALLESVHRAHGVKLQLSSGWDASAQTIHDADLVVFGLGIVRAIDLARTAGLALVNGAIRVNEFCQTSIPDIYAAGDVAALQLADGSQIMQESWSAAKAQGKLAAKHMLGRAVGPYDEVPWMWTEQYHLYVQVLGHAEGANTIVDGDPGSNAFTMFHTYQGRMVGATLINQPNRRAKILKTIKSGGSADPHITK